MLSGPLLSWWVPGLRNSANSVLLVCHTETTTSVLCTRLALWYLVTAFTGLQWVGARKNQGKDTFRNKTHDLHILFLLRPVGQNLVNS